LYALTLLIIHDFSQNVQASIQKARERTSRDREAGLILRVTSVPVCPLLEKSIIQLATPGASGMREAKKALKKIQALQTMDTLC
jgi:hypothetical protein